MADGPSAVEAVEAEPSTVARLCDGATGLWLRLCTWLAGGAVSDPPAGVLHASEKVRAFVSCLAPCTGTAWTLVKKLVRSAARSPVKQDVLSPWPGALYFAVADFVVADSRGPSVQAMYVTLAISTDADLSVVRALRSAADAAATESDWPVPRTFVTAKAAETRRARRLERQNQGAPTAPVAPPVRGTPAGDWGLAGAGASTPPGRRTPSTGCCLLWGRP